MATQRSAVEFGGPEPRTAMSADAIQILFVSSGGMLCEGIARILSVVVHPSRVRCVESVAEAVEHCASADIAVLDGDLCQEPTKVINELRFRVPSTPVVVLLTKNAGPTNERLLAADCAGYVDKSAPAAALVDTVRSALAGGMCLPSPSLSLIDEKSRSSADAEYNGVRSKGNRSALTTRQVEVLALAARGECNKAIASQLNISEGTVKIHLSAVYKTLNVTSRSQAANIAMRDQAIVEERARRAFGGDIAIARLMSQMTPRQVKAGVALFKKGDRADALYYVMRGVVRLEEIGVDRGPGDLLGEIGLFTVGRCRTCTARCATDCKMLVVKGADAMRIFYQHPDFAVYVMHLVTSRLAAAGHDGHQSQAG